MNKWRLGILSVFILLFSMYIVKHLYKVQITLHEKYVYMAERQQKKTFISKAERGIIKDRNGDVLAYTKDEKSFYIDKRMLRNRDRDTLINTFAKIFGRPKEDYRRAIAKGVGNVLLEKKVPNEKAILLTDFTISGFIKQEDYTREYPYGVTASHILGYVDRKFRGAEGLEKELNKELRGKDGLLTLECDVYGRVVALNSDLSENAVPGSTVYLTINKNYQKILEEEVNKGIAEYGGESAVGIIMDPNTGEVLAMANYPYFNPQLYNDFDNNSRKNRALTDPYEPGSTIKPIVMSILLEEKLVRDHEYVNTYNGRYTKYSHRVNDTHEYSALSIKQIIENSSNVGMAILSDRIDSDLFYKYMRDFGFGNPTLIGMPSESSGILYKPSQFQRETKMVMAYGYQLSVTPIQLASAYCALVNGGTLYQPYIISKIVDAEHNVKEFKPTKLRDVISKKTSDKIKNFMLGVVENGTGKTVKIDRISIGGKTGTTQILDKGSYSKSKYYTSFVGFFPVDNPKLVCYVMVSSPSKQKYGGTVAGPIFRGVAERIINADNSFKPDYSIKSASVIKKELRKELVDVKGNQSSYSDLKETKTKKETKTRLKLSDGMPNLINLSMRDAIQKLSQLGIKYNVNGTGKVVSQSISAGSRISSSSICNIQCVQPKNRKLD